MPRAVEIDAVALVKIRLRLAGDDGGEVKDEIGPGGDDGFRRAGGGKVAHMGVDGKGGGGRRAGKNGVKARERGNFLAADSAKNSQPLDKACSQHPGCADDSDFHARFLLHGSVLRRDRKFSGACHGKG